MQRSLLIGAVLLTGLIGCARQPHVQPKTPPAKAQPSTLPTGPVAAVWFDVGYPPAGFTGEMRRLIVGVWGDGQIVWSDDRAKGGQPYHAARVDPATVRDLLATLESAGLFGEPREVNFGPDASYTVVAADTGTKCKWLGSWHEPLRGNPGLVIDQRGIYHVEPGQARPEPSPEYAHFLAVWKPSRAAIEALIPAQGTQLETLDPSVFKLGRAKQ